VSATEHFDVLVVGAGISGIGAAYHLQKHCPGKNYVILEGREDIGGTWDLFRYPGIRSDSDMYTLGYSFKPWTEAKAIADGPLIMRYLREAVQENGIGDHIRFGLHVERASWSSDDARWTVEAQKSNSEAIVHFTCNFLFMCSGYYSYAEGYTPEFEGVDCFQGQIVHPQKWTDEIDYEGKCVVVIGSGATAVTLVPELAKKAAHVTMLQRSPSYVVSRPAEDNLANKMRQYLPVKLAYFLTRWRYVLLGMFFFNYCRRNPEKAKTLILGGVRNELGQAYDVEKHFTPYYNPWDQRLCLVPDSDLFLAIKYGDASVVTDHIDTFTSKGLLLQSGEELEADLVVTATGLQMQVLSDVDFTVDGKQVDLSKTLTYKGMMCSDVPNLAMSMGYTNASWTLKCDLTCEYVCRLLNHMDRNGYRQCCPRNSDPSITMEPMIDFSSGYVQRTIDKFPKRGSKIPWKLYQNYALDLFTLRYGAVDDKVMEFSSPEINPPFKVTVKVA